MDPKIHIAGVIATAIHVDSVGLINIDCQQLLQIPILEQRTERIWSQRQLRQITNADQERQTSPVCQPLLF